MARARERRYLDLATLLGLLGGFLLIATAIVLGGSPTSFLDAPAILIVLGGTFAVTTISFSFREMARSVTVIGKAMTRTLHNPKVAAGRLMQLAEVARRHGILSLQTAIREIDRDEFLEKGVMLVVDGYPPEEVEDILARDIDATRARHDAAAGILRRAAEISPAMGLIGTLIGLVQMLGNLDDPTTIGPSMAVALLTTFYGAVLANMVFSPLASKLERNSDDEILINRVYAIGVVAMARQDNPRRIEMLINSILPPANRVNFFD